MSWRGLGRARARSDPAAGERRLPPLAGEVDADMVATADPAAHAADRCPGRARRGRGDGQLPRRGAAGRRRGERSPARRLRRRLRPGQHSVASPPSAGRRGLGCLRAAHLHTKAAERRFLQRIPLRDDVRRDLWLDEPADWVRLTEAAQAWAYRQRPADTGPVNGHDLACAWWDQEVLPVVGRLRRDGAGTGLRDVQLYITALAMRDSLGSLDWPPDLAERMRAGRSCCTSRTFS